MKVSCVIIGLFVISTASAQPAPEIATRLKKEYENCVYAAVGSQWKLNPRLDPSTGTELAFLACQTEEQAIGTLLYALNTAPPEVSAAIVGIKVALKRNVRAIMTDPAKYKREHGG